MSLLARAADVREPRGIDLREPRIGIIDIGSNSVRLVVYEGLVRTPAVLFNEKLMAGLGRGVAANGRLSDDAMALTLDGLTRFVALANAMGVDSLRAVATAAIREAANGAAFVARVRNEVGLEIETIDGEAEARAAAFGVIAGIPDADGVVGDLGGGSLELIRVSNGQAHERVSLPIGSLRLDAERKKSRAALNAFVAKALAKVDWARAGAGKPFYAVGGSWRALAQLHMHLIEWPLPVIHHHVLPADAPARLVRTLAQLKAKSLKAVPNISTSRGPQLPGAALLLREVTARLGSSRIITSAYGLREGLLYMALPPEQQREDPLLSAARAEAHRSGRFGDGSNAEVGDLLLAWCDGVFADEAPEIRRIRHAACLLADVAWRAHPDFRPERGLDVALHGNWVGIDAPGRAMLAVALHALNGGPVADPALLPLARIADPALLARARQWGLALRLGQRLGGGTGVALRSSRLAAQEGALTLTLRPERAKLYGDTVARRHRLLAGAMGLKAAMTIS
ncbi:Ppx/GppA family phosphatase [Sandaracinobacteroides saxicola]|uniref:Ppx/GppA family phosphatase n=1 Tax=Sandaracinobacteroides saxicola TaxID=2759707 RepID=A0A7G5IEZ9_9SPHN|nr:Ppx/GppA family phosphatase [Sandaracinobacteroides saxicola]QMW21941.1 Ppx/GppA family phosphatase [Sandaracinobacteroides saxicola]